MSTVTCYKTSREASGDPEAGIRTDFFLVLVYVLMRLYKNILVVVPVFVSPKITFFRLFGLWSSSLFSIHCWIQVFSPPISMLESNSRHRRADILKIYFDSESFGNFSWKFLIYGRVFSNYFRGCNSLSWQRNDCFRLHMMNFWYKIFWHLL